MLASLSCLRFVGSGKKKNPDVIVEGLLTLHVNMLVVNGCLSKTAQSANTQATLWSLLSRKSFVIVYGFLMK